MTEPPDLPRESTPPPPPGADTPRAPGASAGPGASAAPGASAVGAEPGASRVEPGSDGSGAGSDSAAAGAGSFPPAPSLPSTAGFGAPEPPTVGFGAPEPATAGFGAPEPSTAGLGAPEPSTAGFGAPEPPSAGVGATAAGFPPPGSGGGFSPPAGAGWPGATRLRRSTQRKVVAGVAGGLGEFTGIDPVLFRVLFAVLTLFGGAGVLLYVIAWLFLPADDQPSSPVESLLGRGAGPNRLGDAARAGLLIVAGLVLAGVLARGDAGDVVLLLVVIGVVAYIVRNLAERRGGSPPQPAAPVPPPQPYERPAYEPQPTAGATADHPLAYSPPAATVLADRPPAPRRERSVLGAATISLLLVVLGVTAALDAGDAVHPAPEDYLALAVGTLGAGLVVGAWFGRARWLTWLGLPALALLMVLGTSGISLEGGIGDRQYAPTRAADIQGEYRLGVGSLRLDLSDVDFAEQLVRTRVSLGMGDLEVVIPDDVDVSIVSRSGIGEVLLFDESQDGTSVERSVVSPGTGGDGRTDLVLDLEVNVGQVRVDRAQA